MDQKLRDAMRSLMAAPGWAVYQGYLNDLVDDWQAKINDPSTDLGETAILRFARTRVQEIVELPALVDEEE